MARKPLHDFEPGMPRESFDAVIVGTGLAGLATAHYAFKKGAPSIALLTKAQQKSPSFMAQGGIAAALGRGDSPEQHFSDTVETGCGLSERRVARILVEEGVQRVKELVAEGVPFDRVNGRLAFTREGGHGRSRILHLGGDATGKGLTQHFVALVRENKNAHRIPDAHALDLVFANGKCVGITARVDDRETFFGAGVVVFASGGYSSLYAHTTNPAESIGEGASICKRAGIPLTDLEFEQFHPTTIAQPERNVLVSEAVRGEGAYLVNQAGQRVLEHLSRAELSPRDIVSRALFKRAQAGKKTFLDCRHLDRGFLVRRFPTVYERLKSLGYRLERDLVPVEPAAHYSIGGIKVDAKGRAAKNVFAVGEAACNGLHGANRLASNSLLEAIVFGKRVGDCVAHARKTAARPRKVDAPKPRRGSLSAETVKKGVRRALWRFAGIERDARGLRELMKTLKGLETRLRSTESTGYAEARNMLLLGQGIAKTALWRRETRGTHYRSDFPRQVKAFKEHSID